MNRTQLKSLLDLLDDNGHGSASHPFEVGSAYMLRTVTYHMVGRVTKIDGSWLTLDDAAWIADSGRYSQFLETGNANEVEPVGRCYLNIDSLTDAQPWKGKLPLTLK